MGWSVGLHNGFCHVDRRKDLGLDNLYFYGLLWDGECRMDTLAHDYLGSEDNEYNTQIVNATLIGAISRVFQPGCKHDTLLVLEGDQGTGKSTFIRELAVNADWFMNTNTFNTAAKDSILELTGKWIAEMGELKINNETDAKNMKEFLGRSKDTIRKPYERIAIDVPRQTIFIASVNVSTQVGYLYDITGNRRFLPLITGHIDIEKFVKDRDQIWAEAYVRYQEGEKSWLDDENVKAKLAMETTKRLRDDPHLEPLATFLNNPLLNGAWAIEEIVYHALKLDWTKLRSHEQLRVRSILELCGWVSNPKLDGKWHKGIRGII
jgi:putative DNA primase/helicase